MAADSNSVRVLIVDDEERFRNAMRRMFLLRPEQGLEFLEASCGSEAVAALHERPFDCVLLDYDMPGGSGIEWLPRLLEVQPDLAVIMVTGKGDEATAVRAMKSGAADYLVKGTIRQENLERAIRHAAEKRRLQQAIDEHREKLIEAERHRVMIESLGAACHHLGQPTTVILTYLELMKRQETSEERRQMVAKCIEAAEAIAGILDKLQRFSRYRTEPYLPVRTDRTSAIDSNIISLDD